MEDDRERVDLTAHWREVADRVPPHIMELLGEIPFLMPPGDGSEIREVYEPVLDGRCLNPVCHGPVAEYTTLVINGDGVICVFCSPHCLQDMSVLGFLQEQHDDLVDRGRMRGGRGDEIGD